MLDDALRHPRGRDGRAPDVFTRGGWVPMREYRQHEEVDFAIVGNWTVDLGSSGQFSGLAGSGSDLLKLAGAHVAGTYTGTLG